MKSKQTRSAIRIAAAAATGALALQISAACASTITMPANSPVTLAGDATFPTATIGNDGFVFPVASTTGVAVSGGGAYTGTYTNTSGIQFTSVATYASVSFGNDQLGNTPAFSQLDITKGNGATGLVYTGTPFQGPDSSGTTVTLATITLSGTVPSEFQLSVLGDNEGSAENNATNYEVYDNQGSATVTAVTAVVAGTNTFYFFDVSDATAGDVITVEGTSTTNQPDGAQISVGGFGFDTITPTPEPASAACVGLASLWFLGRRRRLLKR